MLLRTEEDVRNKVVTAWLADHGFTPDEFSVEPSFEITFGRGTKRIDSRDPARPERYRPRADLLVRHVDGRNLMVIETKAPGERIDGAASVQAISYARLALNGGGMPPFAVVTNGTESAIYDVLTERELGRDCVPLDHPYARSGFRLSVADLSLRAEALERLITLSPDNLIEFCTAQVSHRMRPLRSDDPHAGKKYVPALYTPRPRAQKDLTRLIEEGRRVVLLAGLPQQGKTNLMCHMVEARLAMGEPSLFFPAVAVGGLLGEIREDFEWSFHHSATSACDAAQRLSRIARASGRRLAIFVDGWNEASFDAARAIDREGERLADCGITLVVSLTNVAAGRLLTDEVGNASALANVAGVSPREVPMIELGTDSAPKGWHVVQLGAFDEEEAKAAFELAAAVYGVRAPTEAPRVRDPLVLRLAMEAYQGQDLPASYDETDLLQGRILAKIGRSKFRDRDAGCVLLRLAADEILKADGPVPYHCLLNRVGVPATEGLGDGPFEAALLLRRRTGSGTTDVDFYYSRERDFVVAHWVRDWPGRLTGAPADLHATVAAALESDVETSALRWFLTRGTNLPTLRQALEGFSTHPSEALRRFLLSCAWQALWEGSRDPSWLNAQADWAEGVVTDAAADPDPVVKANAAKLMALIVDDSSIAPLIVDDPTLIRELLLIDQVAPLDENGPGRVVLDALFKAEMEKGLDEYEESVLTAVVRELTLDPSPAVRAAAATAYGRIAPLQFFRWLVIEALASGPEMRGDSRSIYERGLVLAVDGLEEGFYGGMCPGHWNRLKDDPEERREVFAEYQPLFAPIIRAFPWCEAAGGLAKILRLLGPADPDAEPGPITYCPCQYDLFDAELPSDTCSRTCWPCSGGVAGVMRTAAAIRATTTASAKA